jgi:hypothetical protein
VKSDCVVELNLGAAPLKRAGARPLQRFPEDLRTWLKSPALLQLADGVAHEHTASNLRPVVSMPSQRFDHPRLMLALLTYAFASGLWHSRAIAQAATLDPGLIALCHGEPPSAEIIRRFRNQNRMSILRCLELLLRRLWCHHHEQRTAAFHVLLPVEILCDAQVRLQRAERSELPDQLNASRIRLNFKEDKQTTRTHASN